MFSMIRIYTGFCLVCPAVFFISSLRALIGSAG
jgi:hypothetical protein